MSKAVLSVEDLRVHYHIRVRNKTLTTGKTIKAVEGVSLSVGEGETLGIVGESGCGKSTLCRAMVGLEKPVGGRIVLDGRDILSLNKKERFESRRRIQMIFQDAYSTLDPRYTIARSIAEPLVIHGVGTKYERMARVRQLLRDVGLPESYCDRFPHEFSGGQRQRIGVARALALNPGVVLCDEPVSALDVSIQAQILNLMKDLQEKYGLTYVFVSHNLSVVAHLCDRIAVMYLGTVVEQAAADDLYRSPSHPYTQALIGAIPIPDPRGQKELKVLEGDVPSPINTPPGCPFVTRCSNAKGICGEQRPPFREVEPGHRVACHFRGELSTGAASFTG